MQLTRSLAASNHTATSGRGSCGI